MLAEQVGGTGWEQTLRELAELGLLTGDEKTGYRADTKLAADWRSADPRLRHAVRADVAVLPGGTALAPLTGPALVDGGRTVAERDAVAALRELLRDGELAFRFWKTDLRDDVVVVSRVVAGVGYRWRHPESRSSWPDDRSVTARSAHAVQHWVAHRWQHFVLPQRHRRHLAGLIREAERADRHHQQALRLGWFRTDQVGGGLPEDASTYLTTTVAFRVEAYAQLREAELRAEAELAEVRSYPHQVDRTLAPAEAALANAPGADRPRPSVEAWLREITGELNGFRVRLNRYDAVLARLEARLAPLGHGPEREQLEIAIRTVEAERDAVRIAARLMLVRHDLNQAEAWRSGDRKQSKLYRTFGGWTVMETARRAKERLLAAHPGIRDVRVAPAPAAESVIPLLEGAAHPHGDYDLAEGDMSVATRRGRPNRSNQDAATLVVLPGGDRVAVAVDGVYSYPGSRTAAHDFLTAYRAALADGSRRSPGAALAHAHEAAFEALTSRYSRETGHQAVSYVAVYVAADGTFTTSHIGTARAYWLSAADPLRSEKWTEDHTRGGSIVDGAVMTHYLATDFHVDPTIRPHRPTGPGRVVLATDGAWRYLHTPNDLAGAIDGDGSAWPAGRVADAAQLAGGVDDLTAAVLSVDVPIAAHEPGGARSTHQPLTDGDGSAEPVEFMHCAVCGEIHWGREGAAGLLLTHRADDGVWVLMQLRSGLNQHAGTWGLLGGGIDEGETPVQAARREAEEESGIRSGQYRLTGRQYTDDDHSNWQYTWVHAETDELLKPTPTDESDDIRWVPVEDVSDLNLHPRFAARWQDAWNELTGHAPGTGASGGVLQSVLAPAAVLWSGSLAGWWSGSVEQGPVVAGVAAAVGVAALLWSRRAAVAAALRRWANRLRPIRGPPLPVRLERASRAFEAADERLWAQEEDAPANKIVGLGRLLRARPDATPRAMLWGGDSEPDHVLVRDIAAVRAGHRPYLDPAVRRDDDRWPDEVVSVAAANPKTPDGFAESATLRVRGPPGMVQLSLRLHEQLTVRRLEQQLSTGRMDGAATSGRGTWAPTATHRTLRSPWAAALRWLLRGVAVVVFAAMAWSGPAAAAGPGTAVPVTAYPVAESVAPGDEASRAEERALELMQRARELKQLHVDVASLRDVAHALGERAGRVADDDVAAEQISERAFRVERGLAELNSRAREVWAVNDEAFGLWRASEYGSAGYVDEMSERADELERRLDELSPSASELRSTLHAASDRLDELTSLQEDVEQRREEEQERARWSVAMNWIAVGATSVVWLVSAVSRALRSVPLAGRAGAPDRDPARPGAAPSLHQLVRYAGPGWLRAAALRYLIPRDPDAAVRRHERWGTPLVRKLVMGTFGRIARSKYGTNYTLNEQLRPLEAATEFALYGSVFNEVLHLYLAVDLFLDVIGGVWSGTFDGDVISQSTVLVANLALVALQRYSRARMVRAANGFLARGRGYRDGYRNWAGLDQRAVDRYYDSIEHGGDAGDGDVSRGR
jgi:8-oxo-dGTP pyrophosphatase MutT (NUDIX family)